MEFITINFLLRSTCVSTHRFSYVVLPSSSVSSQFLISFLISSLTHWWFSSALCNFHIQESLTFPKFFLCHFTFTGHTCCQYKVSLHERTLKRIFAFMKEKKSNCFCPFFAPFWPTEVFIGMPYFQIVKETCICDFSRFIPVINSFIALQSENILKLQRLVS